MMDMIAGVAQRTERRGVSHSEVARSNRAPRSSVLQAIAAGLQVNRVAYAAGRKDGEKGAPFRPLDFDLFSYTCGFVRGEQCPNPHGGMHAAS
jgi:hypothetical protein